MIVGKYTYWAENNGMWNFKTLCCYVIKQYVKWNVLSVRPLKGHLEETGWSLLMSSWTQSCLSWWSCTQEIVLRWLATWWCNWEKRLYSHYWGFPVQSSSGQWGCTYKLVLQCQTLISDTGEKQQSLLWFLQSVVILRDNLEMAGCSAVTLRGETAHFLQWSLWVGRVTVERWSWNGSPLGVYTRGKTAQLLPPMAEVFEFEEL